MKKFDHDSGQVWANDENGPVALTLHQRLIPVEGKDGVVFPPTYAGIGYNIDTLSDGTRVATMDSVGSQANRLEPLFKPAAEGSRANPLASLIPQIDIRYGDDRTISILDAGHRLGDALIRSSTLAAEASQAFEMYRSTGDASAIARLAPTTIVFGAWDSRGTQTKLPRLLQSIIRAWDVDTLTRSAQFSPALDYSALDVIPTAEREKVDQELNKNAGSSKSPWAQRGFLHIPAAGQHGGIVVHGEIRRDVTINLIALQRLQGANRDALRLYILGLMLVIANKPMDGFLRQGCLLTQDPRAEANWELVRRTGEREPFELDDAGALSFAENAAREFGVARPRIEHFSPDLAKADAGKKA